MSRARCTGTDHRRGGVALLLRLGRREVADAAAAVTGGVVLEQVQSVRKRLERERCVLLDGVLCLGHPSMLRLLHTDGVEFDTPTDAETTTPLLYG